MSDGRRERKLREAREAADVLDEAGMAYQANAVRALCRAHSALADTARRLWRDNEQLRKQAGETDGQTIR